MTQRTESMTTPNTGNLITDWLWALLLGPILWLWNQISDNRAKLAELRTEVAQQHERKANHETARAYAREESQAIKADYQELKTEVRESFAKIDENISNLAIQMAVQKERIKKADV